MLADRVVEYFTHVSLKCKGQVPWPGEQITPNDASAITIPCDAEKARAWSDQSIKVAAGCERRHGCWRRDVCRGRHAHRDIVNPHRQSGRWGVHFPTRPAALHAGNIVPSPILENEAIGCYKASEARPKSFVPRVWSIFTETCVTGLSFLAGATAGRMVLLANDPRLEHAPADDELPPSWIRAILVGTCSALARGTSRTFRERRPKWWPWARSGSTPGKLAQMSENARAMGRPEAAFTVVDRLVELRQSPLKSTETTVRNATGPRK